MAIFTLYCLQSYRTDEGYSEKSSDNDSGIGLDRLSVPMEQDNVESSSEETENSDTESAAESISLGQ